jgi:hypothetical protein
MHKCTTNCTGSQYNAQNACRPQSPITGCFTLLAKVKNTVRAKQKHGAKGKFVCFGGEIIGMKATTPKYCSGLQSWQRLFL